MRPSLIHTRLASLILALALAACVAPAPPPEPTAMPTASPPPTATPIPTDTPVPTATVPPTATVRPSPTFTPTATPTPDWPATLADDFSDPLTGWLSGQDSSQFGDANMTLTGGQYNWEVTARQSMLVTTGPDMNAASDFVLSVDADQNDGAGGNSYGLYFRDSGQSSGYTFEVTEDGYYYVGRRDADGWTPLVDWTRAPSIRSNQPNRLAVIAHGGHFVIYINDQLEAEVEDSRWPTGKAGLLATLYEAGDEGTFTFDNFELREPDEPLAAAGPTGDASTAAEATAQAGSLAARVEQLVEDGVLTSGEGAYRQLPDFDQSLALLDYYQPYPTGYSPTDFVVRADAAWESASTTANWWNSGCGFVFRSDGAFNEYVAHLGLDGQAYLSRFTKGNYGSLGSSYYGRVDTPDGEAKLMLVMQGSHISFFVNDVLVHQREDHTFRTGSLAYTLVSGTNKDFGTRCTMTNVELWELE